eukprot:10572548-Ditylum_brightwellii.AAC.1
MKAKRRSPGEWNAYFIKWVGMNDGKSIQDAFDDARASEWNIKSKNNGIVLYKFTKEKILLIRQERNNGG